MNKKFIILLSIVVLAGISSCVFLEPIHELFAGEDKACASDAERSHCCFICHASQHLWAKPENQSQLTSFDKSPRILLLDPFFSPDPPLRAIFHPPAHA